MNPIRVLLVDDHAIVRAGLTALLAGIDDIEVVGSAGDDHEAVREVARVDPDVVLMDLQMPELDGVGAISLLQREPAPRRWS